MSDNRLHRRLFIAAGALMLVIGACNPTTGQTPSPIPSTHTLAPTFTPTRAPFTPELFSATAVPVFPSPTTAVSTSAPDLTPAIAPVPAACDPPAGPDASWAVYCDPFYGFGFRYPTGKEPIDNTQGFARFFLPIQPGTNLGEKWLDVYVIEDASTCESLQAGGYEPGALPSEALTFNRIAFIKQSGADAGAGNIHEWEAYSTMQGSLCVSLTFILHSTNRLNWETPPPEFDRDAETAVFPAIVATFSWFTP